MESQTSYKSSSQSLLSGNLSVVVPSFVTTWTTTASPVYISRSAADINTSFTRFTTFSFDKGTLWTFCWFFKPIWKKIEIGNYRSFLPSHSVWSDVDNSCHQFLLLLFSIHKWFLTFQKIKNSVCNFTNAMLTLHICIIYLFISK